jgi:hypothetical protein
VIFLVVILGRSETATVAVEYCSFSVVVETLSCALPLSYDVVVVGWCFLVPSHATAATRVYLLVLVWLSGIILSSKG